MARLSRCRQYVPQMNGSLASIPPTPIRAAQRRRDGALVGIAAALAQTLPAGACVRVEWRQSALGAGSEVFGGDLQGDGTLRQEWHGPDGAELLIGASHPLPWPEGLGAYWLSGARQLLDQAVRQALAEQRIASLQRSEQLRQALYEIADLAGSNLDLPVMLRRVHAIVGELMYADNFYIVLYDDTRQAMRFLYFVDQLDPWINDPDEEIPVTDEENTLTMRLLRSGETLRGPSARAARAVRHSARQGQRPGQRRLAGRADAPRRPRGRRDRGAELRPGRCLHRRRPRAAGLRGPAHPDRAGPHARRASELEARVARAHHANCSRPTRSCRRRSSNASARRSCSARCSASPSCR